MLLHLLLIILFVLVAVIPAAAMAAFVYKMSGSEDDRKKFLNEVLAETDVDVDNETWGDLLKFSVRRARWGAIGAGCGFGASLPLTAWLEPNNGRWGTALFIGLFLGGMAVGSALSSNMAPTLANDAQRVSALQPHRLADYLGLRERVVAAACPIFGVLVVVAGVVALTIVDGKDSYAFTAIILGLGVCATAGVAALLARRLLRAPVTAERPSQLIAHDLRLAIALRDLMSLPLQACLMSAYGFLLWVDVPFWAPYALLLCLAGAAHLTFGRGQWSMKVPVARQLASRTKLA